MDKSEIKGFDAASLSARSAALLDKQITAAVWKPAACAMIEAHGIGRRFGMRTGNARHADWFQLVFLSATLFGFEHVIEA
jgi:hypothetical protein